MKFTKKNKAKNNGNNAGNIGGNRTVVNNNGSSSASISLQMHKIWGQEFNGTQDVSGDMINVGSITEEMIFRQMKILLLSNSILKVMKLMAAT